MDTTLFWSRKGTIACGQHAPDPDSTEWQTDGWQELPHVATRRIKYQCQHCGRRAILRRKRPSLKRPLILNVDDRPASLYARDRVLRLHGFTVANADSGHSALDVARQLQPQLILLDVHLPDIDGRELCQQVKADASLWHIPVVLISSTLRGATPDEALSRGYAAGYIAEPVDPTVLAGTIRRVLERTA